MNQWQTTITKIISEISWRNTIRIQILWQKSKPSRSSSFYWPPQLTESKEPRVFNPWLGDSLAAVQSGGFQVIARVVGWPRPNQTELSAANSSGSAVVAQPTRRIAVPKSACSGLAAAQPRPPLFDVIAGKEAVLLAPLRRLRSA